MADHMRVDERKGGDKVAQVKVSMYMGKWGRLSSRPFVCSNAVNTLYIQQYSKYSEYGPISFVMA